MWISLSIRNYEITLVVLMPSIGSADEKVRQENKAKRVSNIRDGNPSWVQSCCHVTIVRTGSIPVCFYFWPVCFIFNCTHAHSVIYPGKNTDKSKKKVTGIKEWKRLNIPATSFCRLIPLVRVVSFLRNDFIYTFSFFQSHETQN